MFALKQFLFDEREKPRFDVFNSFSSDFVKGYFSLRKFQKSLGIKSSFGLVKTVVGDIGVKPVSQYFKMKYFKENRLYLSGIYSQTLLNPAFIIKQENSLLFCNFYDGKNGLISHVLIASEVDGQFVVKTNYPISDVCDYRKKFLNIDNEIVHVRSDIIAHLVKDAEEAQSLVVEPNNVAVSRILSESDTVCQEKSLNI